MSDDRPTVQLAYFQHQGATIERRMETITGLATAGLKALTIINGGAIIGLFTLLASERKIAEAEAFMPAVGWFAGGLGLSVLATFVGFAAQQSLIGYEQAYLQRLYAELTAEPLPDVSDRARKIGNWTIVAATILALASLIGFAIGSYAAIEAGMAAANTTS